MFIFMGGIHCVGILISNAGEAWFWLLFGVHIILMKWELDWIGLDYANSLYLFSPPLDKQ